jgi:hypothetical protein
VGGRTQRCVEHAVLVFDDVGYLRFAEEFKVQPSFAKASSVQSLFYGLSLLFFALGLMSKPMLVTLPFTLLLLDYWPLGR